MHKHAQTAGPKTVSVVIPAHNEERYVGACIESILRHDPKHLLEIIVVDNASTDRTAEVASRYPSVRVVREEEKGLTRARQRGLMEARGDLFASIDADSMIHADWFPILHREYAKHPTLVCLSGPYDCHDLTEWKRSVVKAYWKYLATPVYTISRAMVVGGNFVARRDALMEIGGFDTSIAFYGEDTNLARRLKKVGKVKFTTEFFLYSSGRRMESEGLIRTGGRYAANYFSEMITHKPSHRHYTDVR